MPVWGLVLNGYLFRLQGFQGLTGEGSGLEGFGIDLRGFSYSVSLKFYKCASGPWSVRVPRPPKIP